VTVFNKENASRIEHSESTNNVMPSYQERQLFVQLAQTNCKSIGNKQGCNKSDLEERRKDNPNH